MGRRKSPKRRAAEAPSDAGHHFGVLLEEVRSQMNVVLEAVRGCATKEELERLRIQHDEHRLETRLNTDALRVFKRSVDARFDAIDARFAGVDLRFDAIDARFAGVDLRFDAIDARFAGVDLRFDAIDARLDGVDARLDGVDARLAGVDTRLAGVDARLATIDGRLEGLERDVTATRHDMAH
jgi:archaellum component FlaC